MNTENTTNIVCTLWNFEYLSEPLWTSWSYENVRYHDLGVGYMGVHISTNLWLEMEAHGIPWVLGIVLSARIM